MPADRIASSRSLPLHLGVSLIVTGLVTLASYVLPPSWAASGVGACFFGATYYLVLRHDSRTIRAYGLGLGGVLDPVPLEWRRLLRETSVALLWALSTAAVLFPFFWLGYLWWWSPSAEFVPRLGAAPSEDALGHLVVVALPEEMFYRGYLQTALDQSSTRRVRVLGAELGPGLLWSSLVFAAGHFATDPDPSRLSVFFPSLVFGWLRARTGGVGASVFFHALCNLFAAFLGRSYALIP